MRAITQYSFGDPDVLRVVEIDRPKPIPTEVLIRVHAIGLNPIEAFIRRGSAPMLGQPPFILGWDISGVVEDVVPGVNRFRPGDEVFGMPFFPRPAAAYAELVAAPSRQLARKPSSLDHVHAAALPLAGLTAWQSLVDVAQVQPGQRVLIHAAGGGVGHLAVQIAKGLGAQVLATASGAKADFVRELGADEVIDYEVEDFAEVARDIDVVLESVGGDYADRSLRTLRPGGLLVTLVERTNAQLAARVKAAGRRFAGITVEPDSSGLEKLADWVDNGRLRVHVDEAFPLDAVARAHRRLEGGVKGKLVLTPELESGARAGASGG
jgi:NADPH:quinone reductase-like Zn-dependent oxidoreductase